MLKKFLLVGFLTLSLAGCTRTMKDVMDDEPYFCGIVVEVNKTNVLVDINNDDDLARSYETIYVSLDVEMEDSYTSLVIGDEIYVYFDGLIQETYPARVNDVYAITLKTPANKQ